MAYFEPAVITRTGVNMIANDIAGIGNIEFVKMVSGAGEYTEEEKAKNALAERTELKDKRQEFVFNAIEVKSEKSVLLKSVISNQTLEEGYRITEVGIYAREKGTEGEGFLYSLALAIEADFLPPFNGLNPSEIVQEYYATVSDAATVSIVSAPGAFALFEDMKALESAFADKIKELADNIGNAEDTYSGNATYALGDYCIHDKHLYKCVVPIEEPEEWNGEHWKKVTIAEELLYLANKEVEVVDPMTATEVGFAADAKLTGDALRELSVNFNIAINEIGDAISGLGADVPQGADWDVITNIIKNQLFYKTPNSSISVTGNSVVNIPGGAAGIPITIFPITNAQKTGAAFEWRDNKIFVLYNCTAIITASFHMSSGKSSAHHGNMDLCIYKNGNSIKSIHSVSKGEIDHSLSSGKVLLTKNDYITAHFKGQDGSGSMQASNFKLIVNTV